MAIFLPDILMLIHPVHFKSFFLLSDDIVGMKYFRKKYFLFPQYHLIRGNKIWNVQGVSTLKYLAKKKLENCHFSKSDLPTSNSIFSASKWSNFKISVSIRCRISWIFRNWSFFYPSPFLLGVMVKKPWHNFFWDTLYSCKIFTHLPLKY